MSTTLFDVTPVFVSSTDTRGFWPTSRRDHPRLFSRLGEQASLFQQKLRLFKQSRLRNAVVVGLEQHGAVALSQAMAEGIELEQLIVEPVARGSAAAVCAATEVLAAHDQDAILLLVHQNHWHLDEESLITSLEQGLPFAQAGQIVSFGVPAEITEPGLSYIEMAQGAPGSLAPQPVAQIISHETTAVVDELLESGRYLASAGISLVSIRTLRAHFGKTAASVRAVARRAVREGKSGQRKTMLGGCYADSPETSFETGILQHQQGIVVPLAGSSRIPQGWDELWLASERDKYGVVQTGTVHAQKCSDSLVINQNPSVQVVAIGLSEVALVVTPDAILAIDIKHTSKLPTEIECLEKLKVHQATNASHLTETWGTASTLQSGPRHRVRSVEIHPGAAIPSRSHMNRKETWLVVEGTGRIFRDGKTTLLRQFDTVTAEEGEVYRIENPGHVTLKLLELQSGPFVGDEDLTKDEAADEIALNRAEELQS